MSKLASKRAIRVYEDVENQDPAKRTKISPGKRQHGKQRRVLADIKVQNGQNNATIGKHENGEKVKEKANREKTALESLPTQFERGSQMTQIKRLEEVGATPQEPEAITVLTSTTQDKEKHIIRQKNQTMFAVEYYLRDIYNYLFSMEAKFEVRKNHLEGQELNGLMRAVLIDWLGGVCDHMDLLQETFQLTVYIMDKYMSIVPTTTKTTAQLVGIAALFVAAKYEETEVLEVGDLIIICEHKWTEKDIKNMELTILEAIGYQLGRPLAIHFIRRLTKVGGASPMEHCYAKYFADTSLLSYQLCHVKPSLVAAASIFLALCVSRDRIETSIWSLELSQTSTYKMDEISNASHLIARTVINAEKGQLQGIQTRYSQSQLYCVSLMPGCRPETGIINHF